MFRTAERSLASLFNFLRPQAQMLRLIFGADSARRLLSVYQKITLAIVLLLAPSALAQYGGGGGGHHHNRSGSGAGPTPDTSSGDIKGFERAVADRKSV